MELTCSRSRDDGGHSGCQCFVIDFREAPKEETVFSHGVNDPWQRKHGANQTGGKTEKSSDTDHPPSNGPPELLEGERDRNVRILLQKLADKHHRKSGTVEEIRYL